MEQASFTDAPARRAAAMAMLMFRSLLRLVQPVMARGMMMSSIVQYARELAMQSDHIMIEERGMVKTGFVKIMIAVCLVFLLFTSAYAKKFDDRYYEDIVIVIDTSGSMKGRIGGNYYPQRDIWQEVKQCLLDKYIGNKQAIRNGVNLYLMTFDTGVQKTKELIDISSIDRENAGSFIQDLDATGANTWIYNALEAALNWCARIERNLPDGEHYQVIYFFTDGDDNTPPHVTTLDKVKRLFHSADKDVFIRIITLGPHSKPNRLMEQFIEEEPNIERVNVPDPKKAIFYEIRLFLCPFVEIPFGNMFDHVKPGDTIGRIGYPLLIQGTNQLRDLKGKITLSLESSISRYAVCTVEPRHIDLRDIDYSVEDFKIKLAVQVDPLRSLEQGSHHGILTFKFVGECPGCEVKFNPPNIKFSFDYKENPIIVLTTALDDQTSALLFDDENQVQEIRLEPNATALEDGFELKASIKMDKRLRFPLVTGQHVYLSQTPETPRQKELVITPELTSFVIGIDPPLAVPGGEYKGNIEFGLTGTKKMTLEGNIFKEIVNQQERYYIPFIYEIQVKSVEIKPSEGTTIPIIFGDISVDDLPYSRTSKLSFTFNQAAQDARSRLRIDLDTGKEFPKGARVELLDNPCLTKLGDNSWQIKAECEAGMVEIQQKLTLDKGVSKGEHQYRFILSSENNELDVKGDRLGIAGGKYPKGAIALPVQFKVFKPVPLWVWLVIALIIIIVLFLIYTFMILPPFKNHYLIDKENNDIKSLISYNTIACRLKRGIRPKGLSVGGRTADISFDNLDKIIGYVKPTRDKRLVFTVANSAVSIGGINYNIGRQKRLDFDNIIEYNDLKITYKL